MIRWGSRRQACLSCARRAIRRSFRRAGWDELAGAARGCHGRARLPTRATTGRRSGALEWVRMWATSPGEAAAVPLVAAVSRPLTTGASDTTSAARRPPARPAGGRVTIAFKKCVSFVLDNRPRAAGLRRACRVAGAPPDHAMRQKGWFLARDTVSRPGCRLTETVHQDGLDALGVAGTPADEIHPPWIGRRGAIKSEAAVSSVVARTPGSVESPEL